MMRVLYFMCLLAVGQASVCVVSFWSVWGACIGNCEFGLQVRNRNVVRAPFPERTGDGRLAIRACPPLYQVQTCVPDPCRAGITDFSGMNILLPAQPSELFDTDGKVPPEKVNADLEKTLGMAEKDVDYMTPDMKIIGPPIKDADEMINDEMINDEMINDEMINDEMINDEMINNSPAFEGNVDQIKFEGSGEEIIDLSSEDIGNVDNVTILSISEEFVSIEKDVEVVNGSVLENVTFVDESIIELNEIGNISEIVLERLFVNSNNESNTEIDIIDIDQSANSTEIEKSVVDIQIDARPTVVPKDERKQTENVVREVDVVDESKSERQMIEKAVRQIVKDAHRKDLAPNPTELARALRGKHDGAPCGAENENPQCCRKPMRNDCSNGMRPQIVMRYYRNVGTQECVAYSYPYCNFDDEAVDPPIKWEQDCYDLCFTIDEKNTLPIFNNLRFQSRVRKLMFWQ